MENDNEKKQVKVRWSGRKGNTILVSEECRDKANEVATAIIEDAFKQFAYEKRDIDSCSRIEDKQSKTVAMIPMVHLVSELIPYVSDGIKKGEYEDAIETWVDSCTESYPHVKLFWCNSLSAINFSMSQSTTYSKQLVYDVKEDGELLPLLQMACMLMEHITYTIPELKKGEQLDYLELRKFLFPHDELVEYE